MNGPDAWTVASLPGVAVIREAFVTALGRVAAGQRVVLEVDVGVAVERVAALARDDVEDGALDVAVLGRRAELQHLHFLDRVGVRPRRRADVGAVDLVRVLVRAVAERLRRRCSGRRSTSS